MTEPTFSVCIPNYNYARYVGETIRSVLDQTYPHFEVVVVDNASTDASLDVIRSFHDPRIRVFANRYNIGFAPNLQKATAYARNEYLNLLSADDVMRPDALERYARRWPTGATGPVQQCCSRMLRSSTETADRRGDSNALSPTSPTFPRCARIHLEAGFTGAARYLRGHWVDCVPPLRF